jgi:DNA-directed RNA polymerase subunit RPC12/RpoP
LQAYCMKCRKKAELQVARFVKMKNGKPATEGVCPDCGTKVFRIGNGVEHPTAILQFSVSLRCCYSSPVGGYEKGV